MGTFEEENLAGRITGLEKTVEELQKAQSEDRKRVIDLNLQIRTLVQIFDTREKRAKSELSQALDDIKSLKDRLGDLETRQQPERYQ